MKTNKGSEETYPDSCEWRATLLSGVIRSQTRFSSGRKKCSCVCLPARGAKQKRASAEEVFRPKSVKRDCIESWARTGFRYTYTYVHINYDSSVSRC